MSPTGFPKFGWFNTLYMLAPRAKTYLSVRRKFFKTEKSELKYPGPRKMFLIPWNWDSALEPRKLLVERQGELFPVRQVFDAELPQLVCKMPVGVARNIPNPFTEFRMEFVPPGTPLSITEKGKPCR